MNEPPTVDAPGGLAIRKWISVVEEIWHEGGPASTEPLLKAAVAVVFNNPFAGRYVDDLGQLVESSSPLAVELGKKAKALLNGRSVESYGKAGMAGLLGEQEHVAACLTTVFGDGLRSILGGSVWLPSTKKVGPAGETLDIPLVYMHGLRVRSHYDTVSLRTADAPRSSELMVAVGVASRGRIHARVGGLSKEDADSSIGERRPSDGFIVNQAMSRRG
ncbi:MAG: amino acid synthesis family protein [Acidimicrobiales bacterium]